MSGKKWVNCLFLVMGIILVPIEVIHQTHHYYRHAVDYLVNKTIPDIKGKKYDAIILSDSVTFNAFREMKIHDHVLDLTSNQAISLAGNYFILKRYLRQNKPPKKIFLFFIPSLLHNNLDQIYTQTFFTSVFTEAEEINEIKKLKPELYAGNNYGRSRLDSIKVFIDPSRKNTSYAPNQKTTPLKVNQQNLIQKNKFDRHMIEHEIRKLSAMNDKIRRVPKIYLNKIVELCLRKDIEFTLILEPMPGKLIKIFEESPWHKYIKKKKIKYVNINKHYAFNDYFFKSDGVHIRGKANEYYKNLIDTYIVDLY